MKIIKEHQVLIGSVLISASILIVGFNITNELYWLDDSLNDIDFTLGILIEAINYLKG